MPVPLNYPWRSLSRGKKAVPPRPCARLLLEALEDRSLLSAGFVQTNLASDVPGVARVTDPNLVNPWGVSFSPTGPFWLSDNGSGGSDLLDGRGQPLALTVSVPSSGAGGGMPTGTAFNNGPGFAVSENGVSGASIFLFASLDGTISGWSADVDWTHALVAVNNSAIGAVYTGLAIANSDGQSFLYAADAGRGSIDVFDEHFQPVIRPGAFTDPRLPAGFVPFNVQNINGLLFVTYTPAEDSDLPGADRGFIDEYLPDGSLVKRFASGGALYDPWGMALAPNNFGPFSGDLLVGNVDDGHINAFDPQTGAFLGSLTDANGNPIAIPGLWSLTFGNGHVGGATNALFFTAGLDNMQHGLFGALQFSGDGQVGSTAGDGVFNPNAPGEAKDYPLPPETGPKLQESADAPSRPVVVFLPLPDSPLPLVPTLTTASPSPANSASPAPSSTPVAAVTTLAGAGVTGSILPAASDLRVAGGIRLDSSSLNTFLDVSPSRNSTVEWDPQPSSTTVAAASPRRWGVGDDAVWLWNRPAEQSANSTSDRDAVAASAALGAHTMLGENAIGGSAAGATAADAPSGRLWTRWFHVLPVAASVLVLWNSLHPHRGRLRLPFQNGRANRLRDTVALSKFSDRDEI